MLASKLVEQWLKIAKGETMTITNPNIINANQTGMAGDCGAAMQTVQTLNNKDATVMAYDTNHTVYNIVDVQQPMDADMDMKNESSAEYTTGDETDAKLSPSNHTEGLVYKLTMRGGKHLLAKINDATPRTVAGQPTILKSSDSDEAIEQLAADKDKARSKLTIGSGSTERKEKKDKEHRDKSGSHSSSSSSRDGKSRSDREKNRKPGDPHKSSKSTTSSNSSTNKDKSKSSSSHKSSSSSSSSSHKTSGSKSSSHNSHSSSSSRDKHKSSSHSSVSDSKTSSSSSSTSKSRDKDRHHHSSSKSSASEKKENEIKASQADKDKATLAKVLPQAISKMAKIPKKSNTDDSSSDAAKSAAKKSSISIEVRKDTESRPKTVKTFNSQFRSHGLAEEAPPPPSRKGLKKPAVATAGTTPPTQANDKPGTANSITTNNNHSNSNNGAAAAQPKRSSSPNNTVVPEKKLKLDSPVAEKPGAIKLIPAKPKRKYPQCFEQFINQIFFSFFSFLPSAIYIHIYFHIPSQYSI